MRTFIAVDLDEHVKTHIAQLIAELETGDRNIKWIKRQGMHITLKFLGDISDTQRSDVEKALRTIEGLYQPFPLRFRGTGAFPAGSRNPRVFWVGIDESDSLKALQADIERKMNALGFPQENRSFHPHLTLGRVKKNVHLGPVLTKLQQFRDALFGEMIVQKITFFKSTLKPSGAEYTVLTEISLK